MVLVGLVNPSPDTTTRGTRVVCIFPVPCPDDSLSAVDGFAKALGHRKRYTAPPKSLSHSHEAAHVNIVEIGFRASPFRLRTQPPSDCSLLLLVRTIGLVVQVAITPGEGRGARADGTA